MWWNALVAVFTVLGLCAWLAVAARRIGRVERRQTRAVLARRDCARCAQRSDLWEGEVAWHAAHDEWHDASGGPRCPACGAAGPHAPRRLYLDADRREWPARPAFARLRPVRTQPRRPK